MPPYLVLDACVLMSGVLRPWLLELAQQGMFEPIWSDRIGHEWRRNAARIWDIDPELLAREWHDMQTRFTAANVSRWSDIPMDLPVLKYSDDKDWHVIQAAWLARQANPTKPTGIVTINIKDFSRSELRRLGLDLWEPDRLLSKWWEAKPDILTESLIQVINDLVVTNRRHPAPIGDFLRRERLFRLNKLVGY
ncbi:PIN domain-containing protein [Orrella daihaiensis]|uniref:PIN domain-containing protein n=2 Tax=Orrella daihaiensis TaxID=2782176 RepID=A0ABY4ALT3_9BURK|nr:PIN domain-containing protein [Orrella daihaiensis]